MMRILLFFLVLRISELQIQAQTALSIIYRVKHSDLESVNGLPFINPSFVFLNFLILYLMILSQEYLLRLLE